MTRFKSPVQNRPSTHQKLSDSAKPEIPATTKSPRSESGVISYSDVSAQIVLPVELVHAAAGVHQLLLAGEERVALGANFHGDVLTGGTGLDHVAAGAADGGPIVLGMDAFLHVISPHIKLS